MRPCTQAMEGKLATCKYGHTQACTCARTLHSSMMRNALTVRTSAVRIEEVGARTLPLEKGRSRPSHPQCVGVRGAAVATAADGAVDGLVNIIQPQLERTIARRLIIREADGAAEFIDRAVHGSIGRSIARRAVHLAILIGRIRSPHVRQLGLLSSQPLEMIAQGGVALRRTIVAHCCHFAPAHTLSLAPTDTPHHKLLGLLAHGRTRASRPVTCVLAK